jgi:hypothetical protein
MSRRPSMAPGELRTSSFSNASPSPGIESARMENAALPIKNEQNGRRNPHIPHSRRHVLLGSGKNWSHSPASVESGENESFWASLLPGSRLSFSRQRKTQKIYTACSRTTASMPAPSSPFPLFLMAQIGMERRFREMSRFFWTLTSSAHKTSACFRASAKGTPLARCEAARNPYHRARLSPGCVFPEVGKAQHRQLGRRYRPQQFHACRFLFHSGHSGNLYGPAGSCPLEVAHLDSGHARLL